MWLFQGVGRRFQGYLEIPKIFGHTIKARNNRNLVRHFNVQVLELKSLHECATYTLSFFEVNS